MKCLNGVGQEVSGCLASLETGLPDSYPRYPRKSFITERDSCNALDHEALSFWGRFISAEEPWQATAHFVVISDIVVV